MSESEIVLLRELEALEKIADDARLRAASNKASWNCALKRLRHSHSERTVLKRDREQMRTERNKFKRAVELIAEDCEAWLNSESDEPSADFIKLVAKYAREALQ
jgi:hypothetical protein